MQIQRSDLEAAVTGALSRRGIADAAETGWATAWLEACGYPGLTMLEEALRDGVHERNLRRDALGLDLDNVSCAFLAAGIMREVETGGRAFLRNVRHGLFLLPFTVRANVGIGCPVDPAFAVGGERTKNPYTEKLEAADARGITVNMALLRAVTGAAALEKHAGQ